MTDVTAALRTHTPKHDFLIAIDSDGCAFDSMEIKQKECFAPNFIKFYHLQPVSKYARQAWEFVNLYSIWRGCNRFLAVVKTLDLLRDWDKVRERGVRIPEIPNLRRWVETETKLGNPALAAYCEQHDDADMHQALAWSKAVNASVVDIVHGVPPFPLVRESLIKAQAKADVLVCSATPYEALKREWDEHEIACYVFTIAGQEHGSKKEHIAIAGSGKYPVERMLMIGDAPGDHKAAKANQALFYPINPGDEEASWARFHDEALDRFFSGSYAGAYESKLIADFQALLPGEPPWKTA